MNFLTIFTSTILFHFSRRLYKTSDYAHLHKRKVSSDDINVKINSGSQGSENQKGKKLSTNGHREKDEDRVSFTEEVTTEKEVQKTEWDC